MLSIEKFTPDDLHRELNNFALIIDKEGTYRDQIIDGIGIGRTFASRNCTAERTVEFYSSRHRIDRGVVIRYRIEDEQSERVDVFPQPVVEIMEADDDEIDDDVILTVDQKTLFTFTPHNGKILLERERIFCAENSPILEVPLLGGVPIYSEEGIDFDTDTEEKLIANDRGLYLVEFVLRNTVEAEKPLDSLEMLLDEEQSEALQVAQRVKEMLALIDVLRP
jgi:hypothetical protein